jgi:hypothetical protein
MREWIVRTAFSVYEFMAPVYVLSLIAVVLIVLPMGIFRKTRGASVTVLWFTSYLFTLTGWVYSVGVAFALLGWVWLIVGLLLAGLGVGPIAFIGALLKGPDGLAMGVAFPFILGFGARIIAVWLEQSQPVDDQ